MAYPNLPLAHIPLPPNPVSLKDASLASKRKQMTELLASNKWLPARSHANTLASPPFPCSRGVPAPGQVLPTLGSVHDPPPLCFGFV